MQHFLHDIRVHQVQLDEVFALLSAVKVGEVSEAEAIERLERSPQWVWVAMDPESKVLLAIDVGDRTRDGATCCPPRRADLGPDCAPLFLTDGFREYLTALLTHYGQWAPTTAPPGAGPAQAALAAAAPTPICPGDQDRSRAAPGASASPCGVRHAGGHQ